MKKRILSWLLILVLCLALLPAGALADEEPAPAEEEAAVTEEAAPEEEAPALDGTEPEPGVWVTSWPQDVTVSVGEWAVFSIAVEGREVAETTYQWQYYNAYNKAWVDIAGATYATMYFRAQAAYNGILYHCIVRSPGTWIETEAVTLTVNAGPAITSQPQNVTVDAGQWAVFSVGASGSGLSYRWQYWNAYSQAWIDIAGATYAVMYFPAKTAYSGIYYHCVVTDENGASVTSNYVKLTVNGTLAITSQPRNVTVTAGEWAVFTVSASGSALSYQWQYYNAYYKTWVDIAGAAYATMYFTAQENYNGIYYHCVVTDAYSGSVTSNYVKLTVTAPMVEPLPDPDPASHIAPEDAFYYRYTTETDDDGSLVVTMKLHQQYDVGFTDILFETEGFEVVSCGPLDDNWLPGGYEGNYYFTLRYADGYPTDRAAALTMHVMKGDELFVTLTFWGVRNEKGFSGGFSSNEAWTLAYRLRWESGEMSWEKYSLIMQIIMLETEGPIWEDPIANYTGHWKYLLDSME